MSGKARSRIQRQAVLGAVLAAAVLAVAVIFLLYGAPDLSFTQFMVETLSVVILGAMFKKVIVEPMQKGSKDGGGLPLIIATMALGLLLGLLLLGVALLSDCRAPLTAAQCAAITAGVSARAMVRGLIEGQSQAMLLAHARGALKRKTEELAASLDGDLSERHLFVLRHLSDSIDALQSQIADIDAYLMRAMQPYAWAHALLQTIPGIDEIAAALILIEIGDDMARFGSPERLACWAALSPGNHESAGKRKSGRTRHGNNTIRYILCECANAARMTKSTLAAKYRSLMVRKSHKKTIVAVAHKMIRLIYILLSRRQPYLDQAIDYAAMSARKNAPRWIKQLNPSFSTRRCFFANRPVLRS